MHKCMYHNCFLIVHFLLPHKHISSESFLFYHIIQVSLLLLGISTRNLHDIVRGRGVHMCTCVFTCVVVVVVVVVAVHLMILGSLEFAEYLSFLVEVVGVHAGLFNIYSQNNYTLL